MKLFSWLSVSVLVCLFMVGCGGEDRRREKELAKMPALWTSEIVIASPEMPDMEHFLVLHDAYDASLVRTWTEKKFTDDYIPEDVRAYNMDRYLDIPRKITIRMGDTVEVLACKKNNTGKEVCLVRTADNTYCWLYAFHLNDEDGDRMGEYR